MNKADTPTFPQCDGKLYMNVRDGSSEQPGTPQVSNNTQWMGIAINGPNL
jgi:hypothetical protein